MKIIYKYPLSMNDSQTISVHGGVKPLSAQTQYESPVVWVEVDMESNDYPTYEFKIIPTGAPYPIDDELQFLDTLQMLAGQLIFHVYWRRR